MMPAILWPTPSEARQAALGAEADAVGNADISALAESLIEVPGAPSLTADQIAAVIVAVRHADRTSPLVTI